MLTSAPHCSREEMPTSPLVFDVVLQHGDASRPRKAWLYRSACADFDACVSLLHAAFRHRLPVSLAYCEHETDLVVATADLAKGVNIVGKGPGYLVQENDVRDGSARSALVRLGQSRLARHSVPPAGFEESVTKLLGCNFHVKHFHERDLNDILDDEDRLQGAHVYRNPPRALVVAVLRNPAEDAEEAFYGCNEKFKRLEEGGDYTVEHVVEWPLSGLFERHFSVIIRGTCCKVCLMTHDARSRRQRVADCLDEFAILDDEFLGEDDREHVIDAACSALERYTVDDADIRPVLASVFEPRALLVVKEHDEFESLDGSKCVTLLFALQYGDVSDVEQAVRKLAEEKRHVANEHFDDESSKEEGESEGDDESSEEEGGCTEEARHIAAKMVKLLDSFYQGNTVLDTWSQSSQISDSPSPSSPGPRTDYSASRLRPRRHVERTPDDVAPAQKRFRGDTGSF